jgi:hypothetical protein
VSLYDYYMPFNIRCPDCGHDLTDWRGKDGPNLLFVWQQDSPHPIKHDVDPDFRFPKDQWLQYRLPDRFLLSTMQNGHIADATGVCDQGTCRYTYLHYAPTYGCI